MSAADFIFWFVVFPLHIFYNFYGYMAVPAAVILGSKFVHLRQLALLNSFKKQVKKSQKKKGSKKYLLKTVDHTCFLSRYLFLNRRLSELAADIQQFSSYWTTALSVYFTGFLAMQCYLAYIVFFIPSLTSFSHFFFTYGFLVMETLQWALIFQCAKVAKTNDRLEKINFRFYLANFLFFKKNNKNVKMTKTSTLLKVEGFTICRRLRPYCLHLLDNYRITTKTFYVVIIYTALFFMMLLKRQKHNI